MSFFKTAKNLLGIEIERPPYIVLEKIDDYTEIRHYEKTKWACTSASGQADALQAKDQSPMFGKLFQYISGANEEKQKISMTSPVTFAYQSAEKMEKNSDVNMAMRFFVPNEHQGKTPEPTGEVYLEEDPEMTVAVIRFGGYAQMADRITKRDELIQKLGARASEYDCVNMIAAGYDPPFKPIGRTNEVWLKKLANWCILFRDFVLNFLTNNNNKHKIFGGIFQLFLILEYCSSIRKLELIEN